MKQLLGLYREKQYSPGQHESNDARILDQVGQQLRKHDLLVDLLTLEQADPRASDATLIFSMCQGKAALRRLLDWQMNGARIINQPQAALNTHRDRLSGLMHKAGLSFPKTDLISTHAPPLPALDLQGGIWLKRGDVHASVPADVQKIDSQKGLEAGIADFARRGIDQAVLQAHRSGDEIKFYAVGGDGFFHWFYAGKAQGYPFDVAALRQLAHHAATATGLDIFGGDVIVSPTGELTLIDLNDWPSFAPCCTQASCAIADFILRLLHAD